jgi:hypothetical protein
MGLIIEEVYELGYYREIMNLGIARRYWDFQKDIMYPKGWTQNLKNKIQ